MEEGGLLVRLLVALVAARAAAEIAERLRQPVVLAEIAAGLLVGPSVLGIVHADEALGVLGTLGAILLMFEVGLHMDLNDLRAVGRSALQVAAIGVIVPLGLGFAAMRALGLSDEVALFLAAGITATSVGITARVFADLRALASAEARTVLGAAVADDVAGLLILTIVLGVADGGVSAASTAGIVAIALGFVAVASIVGTVVVPRAFAAIERRARTEGATTVAAIALALGFAAVASEARLAPIVGAFVAGVALARHGGAEDLQRRLAPIAHLLVPLFFLGIGVETSLRAFAAPRVLGLAGVLAVVAVAGKLASGLGVPRGTADRALVGIGMIPRGEVGLIFAGIGLAGGILDAESHALLVLVVLATTVAAPPWLRRRLIRARQAAPEVVDPEPAGGWLTLGDDEVELAARPPADLAPRLGLEAALACEQRRPGRRLLAWLSAAEPNVAWDDGLRRLLADLLRDGGVRAWRLLDGTGLLARLLPDVDEALRARAPDLGDLDPGSAHRLAALEDLRATVRAGRAPAREVWQRIARKDLVRLAAFALSVFEGPAAPGRTRALADRIGLPAPDADKLAFLVAERHLLEAAAARGDFGAEEAVLELAAHIGTPGRADALFILTFASPADPVERERIVELFGLLRDRLAHPELTGPEATDLVGKRRREAVRVLARRFPEAAVRRHLDAAPRRYLLMHDDAAIARHLRMIETPLTANEVRLEAEPAPDGWTVHVALHDRRGALAAIAGAFLTHGVPIHDASISTWLGGIVIDVFRVRAPAAIDWESVSDSIALNLAHPLGDGEPPAVEGDVDVDNQGSPWHSLVSVRAPDRDGLLYRVARAIATAGGQIHHASVTTVGDTAVDAFLVTGPDGHKLDERGIARLRAAFEGRSARRRERRREPTHR